MIIKYQLDKYLLNGFKFIFENRKYTVINLAKYYKNYKLTQNNYTQKYWHYTVKEIYSDETNINNLKIGDVILLDSEKTRYKFYSKDGVLLRKSELYELDYYEYKNNIDSDNARVYKAIKDLIDFNSKKKIRETFI
jgi:hypothetical protein